MDCFSSPQWIISPLFLNTLRPKQNGRYIADNILKCIFLNESDWISLKISLKFVPRGPINNIPALVQTMAWRRPGDKPLSEPMMVSLPTHICITRPQWVNTEIHYYEHIKCPMKISSFSIFFLHWVCYNFLSPFNSCFFMSFFTITKLSSQKFSCIPCVVLNPITFHPCPFLPIEVSNNLFSQYHELAQALGNLSTCWKAISQAETHTSARYYAYMKL